MRTKSKSYSFVKINEAMSNTLSCLEIRFIFKFLNVEGSKNRIMMLVLGAFLKYYFTNKKGS